MTRLSAFEIMAYWRYLFGASHIFQIKDNEKIDIQQEAISQLLQYNI